MRRKLLALALVAALTGLGCYHATIKTGKEPSARTIHQPFANSFILGIVPPPTVQAEQECKNGVAIAETKLSFMNMLLGSITFGLYTPMTIHVTCAQ